jgi:hypothetical protein
LAAAECTSTALGIIPRLRSGGTDFLQFNTN